MMFKSMNVLLLFQWLLAAVLLQPGDVSGQFTMPPLTCPGDTFIFTCNVTGNRDGVTAWIVGSSECTLLHRTAEIPGPCGSGSPFTVTTATGFGTSATSFVSTLSGTATLALNGTPVECFGPAFSRGAENRVGIDILQIMGPLPVSILSCVDLSGDVSGAVNVTVSWTLSGGDSADFYLINITTNAPQTPYGGLLNVTNASVTQLELTGFMTGYEYNITVRGVNCGSQEGRESEPLTIRPQVPAMPMVNVCAVYAKMDGTLQIIESIWNELDNVTVSENCTSGQNIRANYELSYTTHSGTHFTTCIVDGTECSYGRCYHELQNNPTDSRCQPPVFQFDGEDVNVSVTARNIVGKSSPAVSETISSTNAHHLNVNVDTTNPSNVFVECTFFQPGYTCTIAYGTDPSYTNLTAGNTSLTHGQMATIILSQRIMTDTNYYYIVSAMSSSQCVRVRGRFRTECTVTELVQDLDITTQNETDLRCAERGFENSSSIFDGVVCYNGTTAESRAVYICSVDNQTVEATRICGADGIWNGTIPSCSECTLTCMVRKIAIGVSVSAEVIAIVTIVIMTTLAYLSYCCVESRRKGGIVCASKEIKDELKSWRKILLVAAAIFCVIGVILTLIVGLAVPDGNMRDPPMPLSYDGLIASTFVISIVAFILTAALVWVLVYRMYCTDDHKTETQPQERCQPDSGDFTDGDNTDHKTETQPQDKKMERWQIVLLVIAAILTPVGIGLWIALAVVVYTRRQPDEIAKNKAQYDKDRNEEKIELKDVKSEQAAGPAGEETSKQSEQNKASTGVTYAELEPQARSATVMPPSIDDNVRYASLLQSRAKDPTGTPSIKVDMTFLPHSPLGSEGSPPPPIPPQQFLADDTQLSPKQLESSEPHQSERDVPPPRPPKTNQEDAAPPPRPPKTNQEDAAPPPRPPKTYKHTAESRQKGDK